MLATSSDSSSAPCTSTPFPVIEIPRESLLYHDRFPKSASSHGGKVKRRYDVCGETLEIVPLGAGCEVGRSCIVIHFKGKSVMFDCGIHPALSGIGALPVFDAVELDKIDLCLITHFHLDHCGALPYFIGKTDFRGKVYMTEPTKAICKLLWIDYSRMDNVVSHNSGHLGSSEHLAKLAVGDSSAAGAEKHFNDACVAEAICEEGVLYDERDIEKSLDLIQTLDFREECFHNDIKFVCYNAGHVLGACMFLVEIGGVRILYTGDYSREKDRHLCVAEIPPYDVHVLICESTYGVRIHDDRKRRETRLLKSIHSIIRRKGKCLLPVFALGRAQEILLILEEYWTKNHAELSRIPIFYVSPMFNKSLEIFETFINMCGPAVIQKANEGINPFNFRYIKAIKSLESIRTYIYQENSCVIMAAPGMLQSGASREIFEVWAPNKRNGVVLTGYAIKGTIADDLKKETDTIHLPDRILKRRCTFEEITFSAHSDFNQTEEFIEKLKTPNVVLVHGERAEMHRLKQKLTEDRPALSVFAPELLQKIRLDFKSDRCCLALGECANKLLEFKNKKMKNICNEKNLQNNITQQSEKDDNENKRPALIKSDSQDSENEEAINMDAIIVVKGLDRPQLICSSEINSFFNEVEVSEFHQKMKLPYPFKTLNKLRDALLEIYEDVEEKSSTSICVCQKVNVELFDSQKELVVAWKSSAASDLIADSISYVVVEQNRFSAYPNSLDKALQSTHKADQSEDCIRKIMIRYLKENYGCFEIKKKRRKNKKKGIFEFLMRDPQTEKETIIVQVDFPNRSVSCANAEIKESLQENLRRMESALLPLPTF